MWPIIIGFTGLKLLTLFCSIVCDAGATLAKPTKLVGRLIFQDIGLVGRKSYNHIRLGPSCHIGILDHYATDEKRRGVE